MPTITISKNLIKDDLVVIPRKEYESLLKLKAIREFSPTAAQKKALRRAKRNFSRGKTLSYDELAQKLGFADRP